jgi:hypothetical protein
MTKRSRSTWLVAGAAVVLSALLPAAEQSRYAVRREATITRSLRAGTGAKQLLEISTINGSIRVVGHAGDVVDVVVRKTIRADADADADIAETSVGLEIREAGGAILLRAAVEEQPGCDAESVTDRRARPRYEVTFDFDVRVPRNTRLRLCTVNGGDVYVAGTAGDFDIDNVNGAITLSGVRGSGRAETVNGPVSAAFEANPKAASRFKSVNGDLDIVLPGNVSANLLMRTFNGGLFTDFEVTRLPIPTPEVDRRNGMSVYRGWFTGYRVGRGGPELTLDAFNGNIRVVSSR